MEIVLGIDIGTTHAKLVGLSTDGKPVMQHKAGYPVIQEQPGQSEQDPELVFQTVLRLLQQAGDEISRNGYRVRAAAVSAAMHSMLAIDAKGIPLTNALTWADTRSIDVAAAIARLPEAKKIYDRTGTPVYPMSPLCKIAWLREAHPTVFNATAKFISIKEYIFYKLCGEFIIDESIASATGLLDIYSRTWCPEAINAAGISESQLSAIVPVMHVQKISHPLVSPFLQEMVVGGSDGCLANIGSGAINDSEAAITVGTSGAIRLVTRQPKIEPGGRTFNYILDDDHYVTGGALSNGGSAVKWLGEKIFSQPLSSNEDIEQFLRLAHDASPGSDGLLFLPYLSGERAPWWDAAARGAFIGLQSNHTNAHMAMAVLEGIAHAFRQVLTAVESACGRVDKLFATGIFIAYPSWLQLMSNILNRTIIVSGTADASAVGAALIAMKSAGIIHGWDESKQLVPEETVIIPDDTAVLYQQYSLIFDTLYPILKQSFHELHELQKNPKR